MGQKGRPKGWIMPQSVKDQISESKTGYFHDQETKDKIAESLVSYFDEVGRVDNTDEVKCDECGSVFITPNKNYPRKYCDDCNVDPWYRGGVSEEYKEFHQKLTGLGIYQQWRKSVLERDGYKCQHCNIDSNVAHHIIDILLLKDDCDTLFNPNIGITLCVKCHAKEHAKIKREWRTNGNK